MSASKTALSVVLTATVLALTACGNPPAQSPRPDASVETPPSLPSQNAAVADANTLFSARCSFCHGEKRQGKYRAGGALTPERLRHMSDETIKTIISQGLPSAGMPAFIKLLSIQEIESLIYLIKYTSP